MALTTSTGFNPRAHVGRDKRKPHFLCVYGVSIHAPTWGATTDVIINSTKEWFQSTRPRGARPSTASLRCRTTSFNPRAHVGRDPFYKPLQLFKRVSIHAPTWGATHQALVTAVLSAVSIHAPTWGATPSAIFLPASLPVSIHAPTWGATLRETSSSSTPSFNPRAHVGRDVPHRHTERAAQGVSIHAPTWGATP